ncbi:hypothetical protein L596_005617 [Steinernema carpocapsae]|uniref:Uncharacterized protein n=1 Tax=Steinernema carpocapsae TaxID=34508 RepID=A0A4U8UZL2_STECR|nr:hypothetical protein L596_005617 [Steinernema carpocapsae]
MRFVRLFTFAVLLGYVNSQAVLFPQGYFNERKISAKDALYLNFLAQSALEYGGTTIEELNKFAEDKMQEPRKEIPNTGEKHGLAKELPLETHIVDGGKDAGEGLMESLKPESLESASSAPSPALALTSVEAGQFESGAQKQPKSPFVRLAPGKITYNKRFAHQRYRVFKSHVLKALERF